MLPSFLYSLPLLFLLTFGIISISELGYLLGATQQASFFAARSHYVDLEQEGFARRAAQYFFRNNLRREGEVEKIGSPESILLRVPISHLLELPLFTRETTLTGRTLLPAKEPP